LRLYTPTFAELVDRLAIVQLKAIFIPEHAEEYEKEIQLIMHDMDEILTAKNANYTAKMVHATLMVGIVNLFIWVNESKAREGGSQQDHLLKTTHSVNGVRSTAKNVIAQGMGERIDLKVDSLAADLPKEMGNWRIPW
jgi:hypothetical protein